MNDDPTVREWLTRYGDWLASAGFISLLSATVAGFIQRMKGAAIFVSHAASAVVTLVCFVYGTSFAAYHLVEVAVFSGTVGGACGIVFFRVLMKIADRLEARSADLADKLIDKGENLLPGGKE